MKQITLLLGAIIFCLTTNAQNSWDKSGNSILNGDFIGTTNNQDLVFKANGIEGMRLRVFNNTILYESKVIYNKTLKLKSFQNNGANFDRLIAVTKLGNIVLAVNPVLENLIITNTFTANNGITFGDGTVQTTASTGSGLWSLNGGDAYYDAGNVGIGTNDTRGYKLAIKGEAIAEGFVVKLHANWRNWPDYVFGEEYKMKTLPEVEAFINENKHLPNVPSEKEVKEEGINLGEMDAILLQKIEELTLYTIEQQKLIEQLMEQVAVDKK